MRNLMIIIPTVLSFCVVGYGQVKEQFRDNENNSTIVVIKEDGVTDEALLNEHFELEDMNMNDQVMIMTGSDAPEVETATASIDNDVESYFEDIDQNEAAVEAELEVDNNATPNVEVIAEHEQKNKIETTPIVGSSIKRAPSRAKKSYAKKSSSKVKKAAQKKYYSKKKRKKNKRISNFFNKKRSKKRCYSF